MRKLRVGVVTTFPPGTGSLNEYAFHFVKALREKTGDVNDITLFVDHLPDGESYPETEGSVPMRIVPCWSFGSILNPIKIARAVRAAKLDVVLFNIQFASFGDGRVSAALGLFTPALVRMMATPSVVLLHNIMETVDLQTTGFAGNPIIEMIMRLAGTIVTKGLLAADLVALTIPKYIEILESKYKANNVLLAPHGSFDDDVAQPIHDVPTDPMQIMTFGKFGTYKKVERLIEAFETLQTEERGSLELVIAGSDSPNSPDYLATMEKEYAHVPNVRYTGYVAEEDVPRIFGEAAVIVFPYTSTTGSSGVLHQAGDYGKAVVLPKIGDFAEVITEEGYTGEFFEPDSAESLATAIATLIDNPDRRRDMGQQNFMASHGIPISEIVDWYLLHFQTLVAEEIQPNNRAVKRSVAGTTG